MGTPTVTKLHAELDLASLKFRFFSVRGDTIVAGVTLSARLPDISLLIIRDGGAYDGKMLKLAAGLSLIRRYEETEITGYDDPFKAIISVSSDTLIPTDVTLWDQTKLIQELSKLERKLGRSLENRLYISKQVGQLTLDLKSKDLSLGSADEDHFL